MDALGIGKTLFNSSACLLLDRNSARPDVELVISERILRKKGSGAWPEAAIRALVGKTNPRGLRIAENRDYVSSVEFEEILNRSFPFYEHLERTGLSCFSKKLNPNIQIVTHHLSHAYASVFMSPFEKCVILVMDGAGTRGSDFSPPGDPMTHEESSVYLFERDPRGKVRLDCVEKGWQRFGKSKAYPAHYFSEGVGSFYEKSSEYIFNCKRSSGKVMGLAPFGNPNSVDDRRSYLENLDWRSSFSGGGKDAWETSPDRSTYANLAATAQKNFEEILLMKAAEIRSRFPDYDRLILTGGCALNCTANMKLLKFGLFSEIYIPPFPGDESISLGAASYLFYGRGERSWSPLSFEEQHGFFGSKDSVPSEAAIADTFSGFEISRAESIAGHSAKILEKGHVIGWFQGRSECGPRALGNRSILARPDLPGLKDYLNSHVKVRESFRPYGSSCTQERAHEYFDVPRGFENPFMSFAPQVRSSCSPLLREVTHVDGSSRMQTVRRGQNPRFHELISRFGELTGIYCLLNTSLNVMGDPIIETLGEIRELLLRTPIYGAAIGDFFVKRRDTE